MPSALRSLADRLGIEASYEEAGSGARRDTSDATREALLEAMGVEAGSEAACRRSLRALDGEHATRLLAPSHVAEAGASAARRVELRVPECSGASVDLSLELRGEDGSLRRVERRACTDAAGRAVVWLPEPPPPGVHALAVRAEAGGVVHEDQQTRIATPRRATGVAERLGRRRGFGLFAQLYALRRSDDDGAGELGALARLAALTEREGGCFVGTSPLHAIWCQGLQVSPYQPVSRLFRSVLALDAAAVPEVRATPAAQRYLDAPARRAARARRRAGVEVDHEAVALDRLAALRLAHRACGDALRAGRGREGRAYARYRAREGEALERFATFLALSVARGGGPAAGDWRRWPAPLRDPRDPAVAAFAAAHAEEVDFHRYVQFALERQLAATARRARGLAVGLYGDLAVGSPADSADAWAFPGHFVTGASLGAPPDEFARDGQDWGLAPLDPRRLAEAGFAPWIRLLRAAFAHMGALRIDHAMGLVRLWWVPAGAPASAGAYVRQPAEALLGILALESRRAGALVVAEDLGTVPRGFATRLARRGMLSSRVLAFERRGARYHPARSWSARALATANTHDLPPLAALLGDDDLALRRRAGQLSDPAALAGAEAARREEREGLLRRLRRDRLLPRGGALPERAALAAAVTRFLCATRAPLVGLSVDDLAGETAPVNLPGVPQERFRSFGRRLGVELEALAGHPVARAALDAVPRARRMRRGRRARMARPPGVH